MADGFLSSAKSFQHCLPKWYWWQIYFFCKIALPCVPRCRYPSRVYLDGNNGVSNIFPPHQPINWGSVNTIFCEAYFNCYFLIFSMLNNFKKIASLIIGRFSLKRFDLGQYNGWMVELQYSLKILLFALFSFKLDVERRQPLLVFTRNPELIRQLGMTIPDGLGNYWSTLFEMRF